MKSHTTQETNAKHHEPVILLSEKLYDDWQAQNKATQLAHMQEDILSLSEHLPEKKHFGSDISLFQTKDNLRIIAIYPLFTDDNTYVEFFYQKKGMTMYQEDIGVTNNFILTIGIFSDTETLAQYKRVVAENPRAQYTVVTHYFFDSTGNYRKTIRLPKEIRTHREPLFFPDSQEHLSHMTMEDFFYAERALLFLKQLIEGYVGWIQRSL